MIQGLLREFGAIKTILENREYTPANQIGKNLHHIILIHGFTSNKKHLYFLAKHLEENNFNHIYFFEYSILQSIGKSVSGLRKMIEDFPRPVHLIGHSLGGVIARRYSVEDPKKVKSLITLGSPHFYDWHDKEIAVFGAADPLISKPKHKNEKQFVVVSSVGHISLVTDPMVLGVISSTLEKRDRL